MCAATLSGAADWASAPLLAPIIETAAATANMDLRIVSSRHFERPEWQVTETKPRCRAEAVSATWLTLT
jgi:hypothetical protein